MSTAHDTNIEVEGIPATPARIIKLFLGTLITLLLVTLFVGQLNLPYYGKTVWDVGVAGVVWVASLIPVISAEAAAHYPFVVGALGVLWLTHTYHRVKRTGRYSAGRIDGLMTVLALWLLVVYFEYQDTVLPFQAAFFYRVALYCAIAAMTFSLFVMFAYFDAKAVAADSEQGGGPVFIAVMTSLVSGIATGFHGGDVASVSFWGFQLPNAWLHLMANATSLGMAWWFYSTVANLAKDDESAAKEESPSRVKAPG